MAESETLGSLKNQYFLLKDNLSDLLAKCKNEDQKTQLRGAYEESFDNFQKARLKVFQENDPAVQGLNEQLKDTQTQIQKLLQSEQDILTIIQVISSAVSLGTKLLSLASGA